MDDIEKKKPSTFALRLPEDLKENLEKISRETGLSINSIILNAVRGYAEKFDPYEEKQTLLHMGVPGFSKHITQENDTITITIRRNFSENIYWKGIDREKLNQLNNAIEKIAEILDTTNFS